MAIKPVICGNTPVYVPDCDPCKAFESRVEALEKCCEESRNRLDTIEDFLSQYDEVILTKRDDDGRVVEARVLGKIVETKEPVVWSWNGLDTLKVEVNEEFDPMAGVSAYSSQGEVISITVREG